MSGACPDPRLLESFAAEVLEPAERARVAAHVLACPTCQVELGGLAALRLGLARASAPEGEHLDDERLALLVDGALPEAERPGVERHLLGCPTCLGALASLSRALEAVGEGAHAPPRALLERAAAPGDRPATRSRSAWLDWLLGGHPAWRLAAASAAAAAVLALVVLASRPPPPLAPRPGAPGPTLLPAGADAEPPELATPGDPPTPRTAPDPVKPPSRTAPPRARLAWDLLAEAAAPPPWTPPAGISAFAEAAGQASPGAAYHLGRAAAYLQALERSGPLLVARRRPIGAAVAALEPALRAGLGGDPAQARLLAFARDLGTRLAEAEPDGQALQVRVQVFRTALQEALAAPPERALAAELGRLVQGLAASDLAAAEGTPDLQPPGSDPLARLRELCQRAPGLDPDARARALAALGEFEATGAAPDARGARRRAALEALDGLLRGAR